LKRLETINGWFSIVLLISSIVLGYALMTLRSGDAATWVGSIGTILAVAAVAMQVNSEHRWSDSKVIENARPLFIFTNKFQVEKGDSIWSCFQNISGIGMDWLQLQVLNGMFPRDMYIDIIGYKQIYNQKDGTYSKSKERRIITIPGIDTKPVLIDTHGMIVETITMYYKTNKDEIDKVIQDRKNKKISFPTYSYELDVKTVKDGYKEIEQEVESYDKSTENLTVGSYHMFADDAFFRTEKFVQEFNLRELKNTKMVKFYFPDCLHEKTK
jgi:hypothetical protein